MNQPSSVQPYIGLRPFTENERDRFFGRSREISILLDKIRANRLTLLLAASGVGKSSLLQAGIMPALRADGSAELIYHRDWAASPQEFKRAVSAHYDAPDKDIPLPSLLRACTLFSSGQQIILLDQFEEFFNYQRFKKEFLPFVAELSAAILDRRLPASFVISMREDFALELNAFKPFLPGVFDNYFRLEKLTREQARQAIEEPLKPTGWCFEQEQDGKAGLLEQVLNDLAKREQERQFGVQELLALKELPLLVEPPHLQIVCRELWEKHRDESRRQINWAAYEQAERAEGILKTYFLGTISQFSKREQALASAAFDHLIGQRATKVAHPLARLAELTRADAAALKPVLDRLQDSAVLRRQKRGEDIWYELYHDIFSESIDAWNRDFKHRQRRKRLACGSVAAVLAGGLLFAGNNFRANYYGRWMQSQEGVFNRIEVNRGTEHGWDVFGLRGFLYESPFLRQELEADKRFDRSLVEDKENAQANLVGRLPLSDRLSVYAENGLYRKIYRSKEADEDQFVERILKTGEKSLISTLSAQLVNIKTVKGFGLSLETAKMWKDVKVLARLGEKNALCQFLSDDDMFMRINTAKSLGNFGDSFGLIKLLADEDDYARISAAEALGDLGDNSVVSELAKLLADEDDYARSKAVEALGKLGDDSVVSELVKLLADENKEVRSSVAEALGKLGNSSVLVKLLADENKNVRSSAAEALGNLGDISVVSELTKLLADKDKYVQINAAAALGKLGNSSVVSELVKLLADANKNVRSSAAGALGNLGNSSVVSELTKLLADEDKDVRSSAAKALGKLGDSSVVSELTKLLVDENKYVRRSVAEALGELEDSVVVPVLVKLLADQNLYSRQIVVEALSRLKDSSAVPVFMGILNETDVRMAAVVALGRLRTNQAAPEILRLKLLERGNWESQATAAVALAQMNSSPPELQTWRQRAFSKAQEKFAAQNAFQRKQAAQLLCAIATEQSAALLVQLINDLNREVKEEAVKQTGLLAELHPEWIKPEPLLALLNQPNVNLRRAAIKALGQLVSFQGEKKPADLLDIEQKVHAALRNLLAAKEKDFAARQAALDALGAAGRYGDELLALFHTLDKDKDDSLRYRCLHWLGRMKHAAAKDDVENELKALEQEKAAWRKVRQQTQQNELKQQDKSWPKEHWEYMLGNALASIAPAERGIKLLGHPLYQVRQGAIRALAGRIADGTEHADLIGKIIQEHQKFDPADLPSPFPYAAFQAIDLSLWNLESVGTENDLKTLQDILAKLEPCKISGQEGAIQERLEWTIKRLEERFSKQAAAPFDSAQGACQRSALSQTEKVS